MRTRLPWPRRWKRRVKFSETVRSINTAFSRAQSNSPKDSFDDFASIKNRWTSTRQPARFDDQYAVFHASRIANPVHLWDVPRSPDYFSREFTAGGEVKPHNAVGGSDSASIDYYGNKYEGAGMAIGRNKTIADANLEVTWFVTQKRPTDERMQELMQGISYSIVFSSSNTLGFHIGWVEGGPLFFGTGAYIGGPQAGIGVSYSALAPGSPKDPNP